ncbi:MAG: isoleucine--tRNA ligase [Candidatus Saccharibacteria bacterium]|nr:isoleucine--tRNA ligase [Candidatus Saccharibacteria bacterium]
MKFKHGTRRKAAEYEKALIRQWKHNKTFEKSVEQRPADNAFVFYDGPPFLTGSPHHGHLLVSTIKDTVARYQAMNGYRVERVWGWDCHGLPAEVFVEDQLGIKNKKEIGDKISIHDYVQACRAAMVKTGTEWEDTIDRIGRWVEFEGAYKTMDNEFMESVWWAFKKLHQEGKIYEGEKILIYCTKDATPISKSEVAMENSYQLDTDPSVYVYFQLEDDDEYLLTWTTTPWTLPANIAIALNPGIEYSLIEHQGKKFYIASDTIAKVMTDEKHQPLTYKTLKTLQGRELIGRKYSPLFENRGPDAHRVLAADFVTTEEGTGIVHEAPAYGEEDYELCKQENVPMVSIVDENGNYTEGRWLAQNIWEVNKEIAKTLVREGKALKVDYIQHEYPHCHRCGSKLMYRAHPSWFMDIQAQKHEMQEATDKTRWVPRHLQEGRFKNIIESAPDWNISRDRYWATPIPVWKGIRNDGTEVVKIIGSYEEFEQLTGKKLDDYHLPMVMDITFECDGVKMHHIGKVLDCWFESGSMPFAQFHYPFENKEKFEKGYPADFITEAIDQTRGWFYSLTAVNVALFGKSPYRNLICTGFINAADGKKMSKKLKNYTDPVELMDKFSADAFRMLMLSSPLTNGEDFALSDKDVGNMARKLGMIWNMYDFFTLYAEVDGWEFNGELKDPLGDLKNPLDVWVISRVHQLTQEIATNLQRYELADAVKPILPFIDDASNWYVRRSRKRFWKSEDDTDKSDAYRTLHYILVRLSIVLAPFTPFLAEELYQKLTEGESVHLLDWPQIGKVDEVIIDQMAYTRRVINEGLSQRAAAGIKVRQPLKTVRVDGAEAFLGDNVQELAAIITEELNVKEWVSEGSGKTDMKVELETNITPELKREGLAREVIRHVQSARKQAGLEVDDRISLSLSTDDDELKQSIQEQSHIIKHETLANHLTKDGAGGVESIAKVDGIELAIKISKD